MPPGWGGHAKPDEIHEALAFRRKGSRGGHCHDPANNAGAFNVPAGYFDCLLHLPGWCRGPVQALRCKVEGPLVEILKLSARSVDDSICRDVLNCMVTQVSRAVDKQRLVGLLAAMKEPRQVFHHMAASFVGLRISLKAFDLVTGSKSSLVVMPQQPWLCCSPDGLMMVDVRFDSRGSLVSRHFATGATSASRRTNSAGPKTCASFPSKRGDSRKINEQARKITFTLIPKSSWTPIM
ncbi:hypothetical protein HPB47_010004 [Ixodes persulcatus]|uniref:Uncharacterized protein n=1 Tax=Ixodes persulcatus TaxID=34615 RepID=A0AC60P0J5_IXOPE|nr:hypothetical protein HPB47_010004 [Ixodes persulcatus]